MVPDGCPLTSRELETIVTLAHGGSRKAAAIALGVTDSAARSHIYEACRKLDCHNGAELVAVCYLRGWVLADRDAIGRADAVEVAEAHELQAVAERELAAMVLTLAAEREAEAERKREALTPGQQIYVNAFMRWLRSQDEEHAVEAAFMLRAMYYERSMVRGSELIPPWEVMGAPVARRRPPKVFRIG